MDIVYQEDLRAQNVIAVWAGEMENEGELTGYLRAPFQQVFGVLLDQDEYPHFARVFTEPRLHAHYNRPFIQVPVRQLIEQFEFNDDLKLRIAEACLAKGLQEAKTILVFPHLRYPPELSKGAASKLIFIGNFDWPEGTVSWMESEKKRLYLPPFPRLKRRESGNAGLFTWDGIVTLNAWKGFATIKELHAFEGARGV